MAPNSQALKSVRIKNWKIVPFNSFCHPALIAWKWNKIIYGCDCQSVVFLGPTVRWENAFCFDFQKLNTRWFGRWPSCQRHMQYHNWCSANHLYMHRSVWPAFGEVLVFRTVEFSPLSLSALSHSLSLSMVNVLHAPFPSQNQSNGAGHNNSEMDHWHGNSPPWRRSQPFATAPGRQKPCIVSYDTCYMYIYILFVFTCYICLVAMQAGPKASGRNLLYEHVFLQDCKRESAYRRSADAAKQTHTHRHTQCRDNIYIYIYIYIS